MKKQERVAEIKGATPGWVIGGGRDEFGFEFGITQDDQLTVTAPMTRQDALNLAELLHEAVEKYDAGERLPRFDA